MPKLCLNKIINGIYCEIEKMKERFPYSDQEFTYCFRGEAEDYGKTKLTPTLFREQLLEGRWPDKELINLITDYKIAESEQVSSLAKAIEGQHFLALSRLLDITFSILPAIFFASSSGGQNDGYIYIFQFPKTYSPSSNYITEYYENLIEGRIVPYYQNFKVLSHTQSNDRIKSQSGGFILFPGSVIKAIPEAYYSRVLVKGSDKKSILEELDSYFNINESTIYPEKDKKRELIKKRLYLISDDKRKVDGRFEFYKLEVQEALNRIRFEISSSRCSEEYAEKDILRFLRREERDLLSYISNIKKKITHKDEMSSIDYENQLRSLVKDEFKKWKLGLY